MSVQPFDGRASWIWSAEGVSGPRPTPGHYRTRYFRRTFDAPAGAHLTVHASADSRYKLWCNGTLVTRGPAKGDIVHQFYDTVDVTPLLVPGPNVLAARVEYYGDVWSDYGRGGASVSQMTACPGFVLDGDLLDAKGTPIESVATDARWRVLVDTGIRQQMEQAHCHCVGYSELVDCRRVPWGFERVDYDDSAWDEALAVTVAIRRDNDRDSFMPHRLLPRMIAPLEEGTPQSLGKAFRVSGNGDLDPWNAMLRGDGQVEIGPNRNVAVLIDHGCLTTGYPRLTFDGGQGSRVALRYAEALMDENGVAGNRNDLTLGDVRGGCDIVHPDGRRRTYEPFTWRTLRFVRVEIETADQPLTVHGLNVCFTAYPFEPLADIETSEPDTAAICDVSWRTARLCAHETYEDCPYYEQLQYGGDTQIQAMVSYTVAGDASLARQFLYHFDWSRTPEGLTRSRYPSRVAQTIPLFSLHWIMSIADYWQYTADTQTVHDLLPGVRTVIDYYRRHINDAGVVGLIPGWMFADWSPDWPFEQDQNGVPPGSTYGRSSLISLMTAAAMRAAATLIEAAGQDGTELAAAAETLCRAAHDVYFDPTRGLYRDTPDGDTYSAYTNVLAILADAPGDHTRMAQQIAQGQGLAELTMFSTYFAWRALAKAGRYDQAETLMGPWRQMMQMGVTTWVECLHRPRSECHAWGCGPIIELAREVLGVRPDQPGYAVVGIEPKPTHRTWAKGRVPLTRLTGKDKPEFVHVDWRIAHGRFILRTQSPTGRACQVRLPNGDVHDLPNGGPGEFDIPWA